MLPEPPVPCPLCERDMRSIRQKHHLRTRRVDKHDTEFACRECHQCVHALFSNQELRDPRLELDSVEGLLANERFAKQLPFIKRLAVGETMRMRLSNHVRGGKRKWHG